MLDAKLKINFIDCKNINKRLYKKSIHQIFRTWCYYKDRKMRKVFNLWTINVYPVGHKKDNPQYFGFITEKTNINIPHGNAGLYVVNLFINDSNNNRILLQNMRMASLEIAHAVMAMYYGFKNKTMFVNIVHFIHNQGRTKLIKFWFWNKFRWKRIRLLILDISKHVNETRKEKGLSPYYPIDIGF